MTLHLVRHGESEWNVAGRVQGQSTLAGSLTMLGRKQAAKVAEELAEHRCRAEMIVCSDLARARDTAAIIAAILHLPVADDPDLREMNFGDLEGRRFTDSIRMRSVLDIIEDLWLNPRQRRPGGESVADLYARMRRATTRYAGRELILVTHGGPIRVATAAHDPRDSGPIPRIPVANAAVVAMS
jgi:probable phosphoglycerate mutase